VSADVWSAVAIGGQRTEDFPARQSTSQADKAVHTVYCVAVYDGWLSLAMRRGV